MAGKEAMNDGVHHGLIEINWSIIMIWITVIVLFLVLKKFFFEKVKNFMEYEIQLHPGRL